eukprot:jgi/Mesvir1/5543/Mv25096-RA.2
MATSRGLELKLHPLVIINVSDHHTRVRAHTSKGPVNRVIGCLLGAQAGRTVDISNSFELIYKIVDNAVVVDRDFLQKKEAQYKKVFPKLDIVGWYSTGHRVQPDDLPIHRLMTERNENPVYLLLDPSGATGGGNVGGSLPVTLYESEVHLVDNVPSMTFVKVGYSVATVEAERIAIEHVAHILPQGGKGSKSSQMTSHLTSMHTATKMLHARLKVLHGYLNQGQAKFDHSIMRQVASLVCHLPSIDSAKFQEDYMVEYNDTLLATYLASMTRGANLISDFVDKFSVAYDKHGRGRSMI